MDERRAPLRWGIRGRITTVATLLVGVALLLGIGVFANVLFRVLANQLQASAISQAGLVARAVADRGPASVRGTDVTSAFDVQVVDPYGNVAYTTSDSTPLAALRPLPGGVLAEGGGGWWWPFVAEEAPIVAAQGVEYDGAPWAVLVATPLGRPHETVSITVGVLLASLPLVLALVAVVAWWVVGRALRPVEDLRAQVEAIGATRLGERVPVPDSRDEIAALAVTMNAMLARLAAAREAQLLFVADASHELRSPVTALSGALELIGDGSDGQVVGDLVPLMRSETERLGTLVAGLLYLARADAQPAPTRVDVDLDDLALAEVTRLRAGSGPRSGAGAGIEVRGHIAPVRVVGDPEALTHLLRNLGDNAVRHAASRVVVGVGAADGVATLTVEDDGAGVPPAERGRIFERFVRLDAARSRDAGGAGLGLAIVAEIARSHGGTVRVDDSPRLGGARFTVTVS